MKGHFPNVDVCVCDHTDSTGGDDLNLEGSPDHERFASDLLSTSRAASRKNA